MEDKWKGTIYTICENCNQVVLREDLIFARHFCRLGDTPNAAAKVIWD